MFVSEMSASSYMYSDGLACVAVCYWGYMLLSQCLLYTKQCMTL